ncbi:MAG: hypothetical protein IPN86_14595 [Saprospiraceae bacterium]|nr:hypothetical protein [Saprospiraceae bacterium]
MLISRKLKEVFFISLLLVYASISAFGQKDCNCNPQIEILMDDCATQGQQTEVGFYIYDSFLSNQGANKWVKVFAGNELVLDKAIQFSEKGIFGEVFKFAPSSDTKILVEFHCDKDKCYNTSTKSLRTIPDYTVSYKDISCFGSSNGEVKLMPETIQGIDLVWESGERKNFVEKMHEGLYKVTVENTNGCKEVKEIFIREPNL